VSGRRPEKLPKTESKTANSETLSPLELVRIMTGFSSSSGRSEGIQAEIKWKRRKVIKRSEKILPLSAISKPSF
jgi:hypothetical protein